MNDRVVVHWLAWTDGFGYFHPCQANGSAIFASSVLSEWSEIELSLDYSELERECESLLKHQSFSIQSTVVSLRELYAS